MRLGRTIAVGLCLFRATPISAQLMGATELKVGVPAKGLPSSKPVADIYYLAGESGAKETYTLSAKGPASISIYSPGGHEMLKATGTGTIKLEAVLPFTDVFTVAVARKDVRQPYTLSRKVTVPTLAEAMMAESVGFESTSGTKQCWDIPGVKLSVRAPGESREYTLAADRQTITWVFKDRHGITTGDMRHVIEGESVKATYRSNGKVEEGRDQLDFSYQESKFRGYSGYLCSDAD